MELVADLVSEGPEGWPAERIAQQSIDTFGAVGSTYYNRTTGSSLA